MSSIPRQTPPLFSPAPERRVRNLTAPSLVALAVICAIALGLQMYHFWPLVANDAFISLRYSQRLIEGHGLTRNNLPPAVGGDTSLLWTLLCAGLGAFGMKLESAAQLLGIVSTIAGITAVAAQVYRDYPAKIRFLSALIACLALSLSAPVAVWALGGLEQPLLAALLAWAAYFGIRWVSAAKPNPRDADVMGLLLGFAVLTRADAALFTALFYAGAVLADGMRPRSLIARARLLPIPILFFAGQEFFRHVFHGTWMSSGVRVAFTWHRLSSGLWYELYGFRSEFVFLLLTLIGCIALVIAHKKRQVILLGTISAGWLFYVLILGGDNLPFYRHFVPAMALMGFLVAGCGLLTLSAPFRFSRARVAIFLILTLLVLTSDFFARGNTLERKGEQLGIFLWTALGAKHPLLISEARGAARHSSRVGAIDAIGWND
jgi:arabinofuranosyltransferase